VCVHFFIGEFLFSFVIHRLKLDDDDDSHNDDNNNNERKKKQSINRITIIMIIKENQSYQADQKRRCQGMQIV